MIYIGVFKVQRKNVPKKIYTPNHQHSLHIFTAVGFPKAFSTCLVQESVSSSFTSSIFSSVFSVLASPDFSLQLGMARFQKLQQQPRVFSRARLPVVDKHRRGF